MDQLYPLVCPLPQEDGEQAAAPAAAPAEAPEKYVDLPRHVWTKPLTQEQWDAACATIMWWAMHGGC